LSDDRPNQQTKNEAAQADKAAARQRDEASSPDR